MTDKEKIDHPQHYGGDTVYEAIKVIEAWGLGFNLGNAVKYISRAGRKDNILEDLKKARWYLTREITEHENSFREAYQSSYIAGFIKEGLVPQAAVANAVNYIKRADKRVKVLQDLKEALKYLDDEILDLENV